MAVIGEFTTNGNNSIVGTVRTLIVSMKARLNPIERVSRDAPDFRVTAGRFGAEIGAGWKQTSNDGEPYVSVKLDDPVSVATSTQYSVPLEQTLQLAMQHRNVASLCYKPCMGLCKKVQDFISICFVWEGPKYTTSSSS